MNQYMPDLRTGTIHTADGTITHMVNGKIHRDDGPAVEFRNGNKHYYKNGKFHRDDGPAIDNVDGYKVWMKEGLLHRLDGPARQAIARWEWEWWIDGKLICKGNDEEFQRLVKLRAVW
jgi:flagellar basal body rod protein FlgG